MYKPGGHVFSVDYDGREEAVDTVTCAHCCRIVKVRSKLDDVGGFCRMCMKPVCAECVDKGTCTPFEKKLEAAEAAYHALRSYGWA